jgi:hypothetical protein
MRDGAQGSAAGIGRRLTWLHRDSAGRGGVLGGARGRGRAGVASQCGFAAKCSKHEARRARRESRQYSKALIKGVEASRKAPEAGGLYRPPGALWGPPPRGRSSSETASVRGRGGSQPDAKRGSKKCSARRSGMREGCPGSACASRVAARSCGLTRPARAPRASITCIHHDFQVLPLG